MIIFIIDDFIIEPLQIGWLSSYLKQAGFEVQLVKTVGNWLQHVIELQPMMVCYSVNSATYKRYVAINNELRKYVNTFSLFGGSHCTFFPDWHKQEDNIDAICKGEGWDAIVEVAEAVKYNKSISNIYNINDNPLRPLKDKTTLLLPDRALMYTYKKNYTNPIKNVISSFGCYGHCSYCYSSRWRQLYNIKGIELRPVSEVIRDINALCRFPVELIFFQDDIFPIYNIEWIDNFIDQYANIRIPFHIQVRIELVNKWLVDRLVAVGLHGVTYAVESANDNFRRKVLCRKVSNDIIFKNNKILKDAGVRIRIENMLGAPSETYQQALDTLKMNIQLNPDIGWASIFQPYPGTKLGDKFFDSNYLLPEDFFTTQYDGNTRITNLQKFFSLGTQYPFLVPIINQLTKIPPNKCFSLIYRITKKLLYNYKLYKIL